MAIVLFQGFGVLYFGGRSNLGVVLLETLGLCSQRRVLGRELRAKFGCQDIKGK